MFFFKYAVNASNITKQVNTSKIRKIHYSKYYRLPIDNRNVTMSRLLHTWVSSPAKKLCNKKGKSAAD